ncbi:MAG: iron ABC transporter [Spirochaetaceae bacterium]|nr:MAG: iron ABC transporter [Spirochaetaceae bacterium]
MITQLLRVLSLADYNTRVVMFGTVTLGIAGGVAGVFLLLRRRALLVDAVSHASLPGVAAAFLLAVTLGGSGRSLPVLMLGALVSGLLGMGCVIIISRFTRLSQDAALGIVLSVFFGFGAALLGIIQKMRGAQAAGLDGFIFGKTASMIRSEALLIGIAALVVIVLTAVLFKELRLFTFDPDFAAGDGWPVQRLDLLLMTLVVAVTILGLQAVGIILIIAILIVPPAAARFWTDNLLVMVLLSALIGALGAYFGTGISAIAPRLPAGAVIVTVLGAAFLFSLLFGSSRGVVRAALWSRAVNRNTLRQNLLRALFEYEESGVRHGMQEQLQYLQSVRGWTVRELRRAIRMLARSGMIYHVSGQPWRFSETGSGAAMRVTRNHRLWEVYLLEHADVAPSQVDQGADFIEHVLGETLVAELEAALPRFGKALPTSVHSLSNADHGGGG